MSHPIVEWARNADRRWQRRRHPERRRVLVDARTPVNFQCVAPIYHAMRADRRVEVYFTATEAPHRLAEIYHEGGGTLRLISPRRAALLRFDAYLSSDFMWARLPRGVQRIQMFHGVAGKYDFDVPDRSVRSWHRFFFINRRRMQNYFKAGVLTPDSPAARLVGMPKVDCLVDGSLRRDSILAHLNIDPARTTILYAPTWSPASSLNAFGEQLLRSLADAGFALILKLHDRSRDPGHQYSGGVNWIERLTPIVRASGGHVATGSNSCPYLVASDLLITDHSSIGFEYLLLDRPLVRLHLPRLLAAARVHPDYVELLRRAAHNVEGAAEAIVGEVERAFLESGAKSAVRREVAAELYYGAGGATARAVAELYRVIELDPPAAKM